NSSIHLDKDDYPKLAGILASNRWSYLPQQNLPIEPFDYTSNLEIITLTGDYSQQDTEISGLYNDAVNTFGSGQVLAILACKDGEGHYLYKREANDPKTTTSEPEKTEEDFVYISQDGKGILYTTSALILHFNIFIRFNFTKSGGYWSLQAANIDYNNAQINSILPISRRSCLPEAPIGFSYRCSSSDLFFNGTDGNLTIKDFQVQPWTKDSSFSDAYNCVGFVTIPILSGLFICSIVIGILSVGINLLMSIKTPTKFDNNRSKQLSFTVQD
uniref:Vacuolar ATP synthase subunit S1 n=1 Tax=Megaselia scalaris TaxID=36166 RepID=T1GR42_MEGSC